MTFKDFFKENIVDNIGSTIAKAVTSFAHNTGNKIGPDTKFGQAFRKGYSSVKKSTEKEKDTNTKKVANTTNELKNKTKPQT